MKFLLSIALGLLTVAADAQTWLAYNPCTKPAGTPYQAPGDLVTVAVPGTKSKNALAFLTQTLPTAIDLTGQTIDYTVQLDGSSGAYFADWPRNRVNYPLSIRLWFSSDPNKYCFGTITDANAGQYWWSQVNFDLKSILNKGEFLLQETLADPSKWSHSLGKRGDMVPEQFAAAVAAVRQIGVGLGNDNFFDLGVRVSGGTATLHVR